MKYLAGETDFFKGKVGRLKRYLVCSLQGYFPVVVKTGESSLAVIYRTGGTHVSLSGTLAVAISEDSGKSWSDPVEITPRWEDSRNPAFGLNDKGELVAAYYKAAYKYDISDGKAIRPAVGKHNEAKEEMQGYVSLSSDNGRTWADPIPFGSENIRSGSPYGRMILAPDKTMLMSYYGVERGDSTNEGNSVCLLRSRDGGMTWGDETLVARGFNETSFAFMPDGSLVAAARNQGVKAGVSVMESRDMGYTWSEPRKVTRDAEHPADLTLLNSGRLLMTFGRRIRPFGCGALLSDDGGKTWNKDQELLLAGDGIRNGDLGYPSTVQLDNGTIVTVMYYASGSEMSEDSLFGWGDVSCQALHYTEKDIFK